MMMNLKLLATLLLYSILQVSKAQTLIGTAESDQYSTIVEFSIPQKKLELTQSFTASTGMPDIYASSQCVVDAALYGITCTEGTTDLKSLYVYKTSNKELQVLYTFPAATKGNPALKAGTNGMLYGVIQDPAKGAGIFEFNPTSKQLQFYAFGAELKLVNDYYFCVGQDGNVYVFYEKAVVGNEYSNYSLLLFNVQNHSMTEKINTQSLYSFFPMTFCDMVDVGNGLLVVTFQRMGGGGAIIVCDYNKNTIREIPLESKHISSRTTGRPVVYKGNCYVMADVTSKKSAGIYKINLATGAPELIAVVGKLPLYLPLPCVVVGDKLYGVEADRPILFEYDFTTLKFSIVGTYGDLKIRKLGRFAMVK